MDTPRLTQHARERCAEMEISTKVAKHIVKHADIVRPGRPGTNRMVSVSDLHPEYIVVHTTDEPPVIITVSFRNGIEYERNGAIYIPVEEKPVSTKHP
jgi:hypothetical protein